MIEYVVVYPYVVDKQTKGTPLILKNKPEYLAGMLNLPGGKIEQGETPVQAAERELFEETGLEDVQTYDGCCYCPSECLGYIKGNKSIIYCVRVPVCSRQKLNPRSGETEQVKWYSYPELFKLKNLMPNLRIIIPLMDRGVKDWMISDLDDGWRTRAYHTVILQFKDMDHPISVSVHSVGHYDCVEDV